MSKRGITPSQARAHRGSSMAEDAEPESSVNDDDQTGDDEQQTNAHKPDERQSELPLAVRVGAIVVAAVAVLASWTSYQAWRSHQGEQQRELFLRVARQGAQDFTTISYTEVEADVQRILDTSTGLFHDDFSQRSQQFIDHIKAERSTSHGDVTAAGLESADGNSARALVAVAVKLSTAAKAEEKLNGFRLRIDLQRVGDGAKVSNVEYVA
jgi:Mce-associated membrane protein